MTNKKHIRRGLAGLLAVVMLFSLVPAAFAAQENGYHDPAEHWLTANNRTNELACSYMSVIQGIGLFQNVMGADFFIPSADTLMNLFL